MSMSGWWRAYDEAIDDPKLQLLPPALFKAWFNLMCIVSGNRDGTLPQMENVAFRLRISTLKAQLTVSALMSAGLLERDANGLIRPHNWNGRQYKSDVSTPRVKRFRRRFRNVSETAPEQTTDYRLQTTEKKKKERETRATARGARLEKDWWPSIEDCRYAEAKGLVGNGLNTEAEKFRNYWIAKVGKDAAKVDWHATWQNWVMRAMETRNGHGGRRQTLVEIGEQLADEAREIERRAGLRRPDDSFGSH